MPCDAMPRPCLRRRKVKEEMTRVWRKIYEGNYYKSLDHRSFYFKQVRVWLGRRCVGG